MKQILSSMLIVMLLAASLNAVGQEASEKQKKKEREQREFFESQQEKAELERHRAEARRNESARTRENYIDLSRSYGSASPAIPAPPAKSYSTGEGFYVTSSSGSSSSQLSLSKSFDGQSGENEGTFDVDESVRHIALSLSGQVKEGEIIISITLPDGDELKDLTIDASADIQFNQTIRIADEEDRYYGQWEYAVESKKAIGFYRLSIQTR